MRWLLVQDVRTTDALAVMAGLLAFASDAPTPFLALYIGLSTQLIVKKLGGTIPHLRPESLGTPS